MQKMRSIIILALWVVVSNALINDINEDCIVINPISNTIITAGEKMKIAWANSHVSNFSSIYLVQSDGAAAKPIVIAENVPTELGHITVQLPRALVPSNAYYMTVGTSPNHCQSGNLRIVGASSNVPDPGTPSTLEDQINSGRFPTKQQPPTSEAKILTVLRLVTLLLTAFIVVFSTLLVI